MTTPDPIHSFGIKTAGDYLRELVHPSLKDFLENPNSIHRAITYAILTWQTCDWVWVHNGPSLLVAHLGTSVNPKNPFGEFREKLINTPHPDFRILDGIANGSKHCVRDKDKSTIKSTGHQTGIQIPLKIPMRSYYLVVDTEDGVRHTIDDILRSCVTFWDQFFLDHSIS